MNVFRQTQLFRRGTFSGFDIFDLVRKVIVAVEEQFLLAPIHKLS